MIRKLSIVLLVVMFRIVRSNLVLLLCAEKFRFSAEFIEMRRQALDVFVNRIASHHELQQSEDLRTFLQADEEVMAVAEGLYIFWVLEEDFMKYILYIGCV